MFKNRTGSALPLVLIVLIILSLLGMTLISIASAENIFTLKHESRIQAYYVARSGADAMAQYLVNTPGKAGIIVNNTSDIAKATGNIEEIGNFEVDVEYTDETENQIKITSTGYARNSSRQTSVVMHQLSASEIFDKAIYSKSALDISIMKVTGDVVSGGSIEYTPSTSNSVNAYHYTAYPYTIKTAPEPTFPTDLNYDIINGESMEVKKTTAYINGSYKYDKIKVTQNGTLQIDVDGDNVVKIMVNELIIDSSLVINASGTGRVELYINDLMDVTTKGTINNNQPEMLSIYLKDGSLLELQAGKVFNALIYGPNATVQIQSNKTTINGSIIANVVQRNSNNGPNGVINFVPISEDYNIGYAIKAYKVARWE